MEPVISQPISQPQAGAHIAPFFVLNGDLREPRLRQMIEEYAEAGFDAITLHPRPGLRTPYLSKAWFAAIAFCLREAEAHGLKVWLYDEYPYPSGAAGGRVVQRNPDFAEKHLSSTRHALRGGGTVTQALGADPVLEAFLAPLADDGKVQWSGTRVVTDSVGMRNTTWITRAWDSRFYYPPEHTRRYECRRAMEYLPEYVFEDAVPDGRWVLITFTVTTGSEFLEPFGDYVDLSNREATDVFLEETHERYREHFGSQFGAQILGVFTDEPKYRNAFPWSRTIAEAWADYQRDPRALLALLPDAEADELLGSFRRVTTRLFAENWVRPIHDWCQKENLKLIGHISPEEDWWAECRHAGSILRHLREFSIPGCDIIIPAVGDRAHPVLNLTPSLAASAAAQNGAGHALCETFGCSNYSLDMQTVKRVSDWLMVYGINFIVPHGCFYSLAGPRRFDAPPTFLSPSTLQPFLAQWSAHVRNTAKTLGPNRPAGTAIVRPMSHLFTLSEDRQEEATRLYEHILKVVQHLMEHGIAFHWIDDTDLPTSQIQRGTDVPSVTNHIQRGTDVPSVFHPIETDGTSVPPCQIETDGTSAPPCQQVMPPSQQAAPPSKNTLRVGQAAYDRLIGWSELLPPGAAENLKGIPFLSPTEALLLKGPLECPEGDVCAAHGTDGRWFCVNLSPQQRRFKIESKETLLDGYESRWVNPQAGGAGRLPVAQSRMRLGAEWRINPPAENTFRLMDWTCNGAVQPVGAAYHSLVPEADSVPTVYGPVPQNASMPAPRSLVYETVVPWDGPATAVSLVLEDGTVEGPWQASLNGAALSDWRPRTDFFGGCEHVLTPLLRPGENHLRLEITADDARHGLWTEPHLRGDFVVTAAGHLQASPAVIRGGDWSRCGYPHYSGSMDFEQTIQWNSCSTGSEAWLVFETPPAGMVEVLVNDESLGQLLWSPWRLRIQDALCPGPNTLCLRITNTLHNFISGKAHCSGPLAGVEIQTFPMAACPPTLTKHSALAEAGA